MDKAVILAAGRGTRMRADDGGAALTAAQRAAAERGWKGLIPDHAGRPFLDHVLGSLAAAGYRRLCLVVGEATEGALRARFEQPADRRLAVSFAVQAAPRGTADALLAAAPFVGAEPFLSINADNLYPVEALRALRALDGPGLAVFERRRLLASGGNLTARHLAGWALVELDEEGYLKRIVEKPDAATAAGWPRPVLLSANCWRLSPAIFDACRAIAPSPRGELELPAAVRLACRRGMRLRAVRADGPVLDLSRRADIAAVAALLAARERRE